MTTRVGIIQSSYIPWRGYFAMIAKCDIFLFLDSVQFTRRDWRNRNRIKTPNGPAWLSIPVHQKNNFYAPIDSIEAVDHAWIVRHLRSIELNYRRAPYFSDVFPQLVTVYSTLKRELSVSKINQSLIAAVCEMLDIKTSLRRDVDLLDRAQLEQLGPTARLLELAKAVGATDYISGPAARTYLDETLFATCGIGLTWMDYGELITYPQLWTGFDPKLSVVDALLNLGGAGARATLGG